MKLIKKFTLSGVVLYSDSMIRPQMHELWPKVENVKQNELLYKKKKKKTSV